jgi:hypothetical protein
LSGKPLYNLTSSLIDYHYIAVELEREFRSEKGVRPKKEGEDGTSKDDYLHDGGKAGI